MDQRSPYAPPESVVEVAVERKGAAWKAVVLGLLIDFVGTIVAGLVFILVAGPLISGHAIDSPEFEAVVDDPLSPVTVSLYLIGTLFSVLGGYVCARVAKHNEWRLAAILATLSTLLSAVLGDETTGLGMDLLLYSAGITGILLGSWIGMKRNHG